MTMRLSTEMQEAMLKHSPASANENRGTKNREVFNQIITATSTYYLQHRSLPTSSQLIGTLPKSLRDNPSVVLDVVSSPGFLSACRERGLPTPDTNPFGLTAEQSYVLSIMTNPSDRRTLQAKLKTAGVVYSKYQAWLKQPGFSNAMRTLSEGALEDHTGDVLIQLGNRALAGDQRAIEYYLEVTGRHDPKRAESISVQGMMTRVIEIISKHVKDPATLNSIAGEFALLGAATGQSGGPTVQSSVVSSVANDSPDADDSLFTL